MAKVVKGKVAGRVLVSLLVVGLVASCALFWGLPSTVLSRAGEETAVQTGSEPSGIIEAMQELVLVKPAFALGSQAADLTFLEKEAGISAYTDVGRRIDLVRAKGAFRTIERETTEYLVGSVKLPGKDEYWDVHCFVHRDGWIIAYYHRDWSTGKIIDWGNPAGTHLETALGEVAAAAGVHFVTLNYYDFRFPAARKMLVIVDSNNFRMLIPNEFVVYNRAYSLRNDRTRSWDSAFTINGAEIARTTGITIGTISPSVLRPGAYHTIAVEEGGTVATILTYSEQ